MQKNGKKHVKMNTKYSEDIAPGIMLNNHQTSIYSAVNGALESNKIIEDKSINTRHD